MAGISVGSVTVDVLPDMSRFATTLRPQVNAVIDDITRGLGGKFSQPIADGIGKGLADGFAKAPAAGTAAGSSSGGKFADAFKARVDAALKSLPNVEIGADSSEVDRKIAGIRAELEALSNTTVGVDISDEDARVAIDDIKARLDELGAKSPSVQVRADTLGASAELAKVQAEMDRLNGETANVNVKADTTDATSSLGALATTILTLGPALIPIGAAATGAIGGVATAAASGAAGLGVLALGFSDVSSAVGLLGKEHTAAAQQAAQSATAEASSANASVRAAMQVQSAQAALGQARETAANQAITSAEQVANAERSLGTTEQQVAQRRVQAAQQVADAEYALTQANQQAANAQKALNNAREQAARDLESAANRQVDANLAVQQSQLNLMQAEVTYQQALANPKATALERQQDALNIAQAQQSLVEAQQEVTNATEDNTAAQAAGVAGAPGVVSATQAIATAQHGQQTATQALADAQGAQVQQQKDGAAQIAQAQQAVADAERAAAQSQEQSAYSIASAQRGVASALQAAAVAHAGNATAATTAMQEIQAQLGKTNPAVLAFATFITGTLEPAFNRLKDAAAGGLIPGVQQGIEDMMPLLPSLTGFVGNLATTMGHLASEAGKALTSPFWTQFFSYVSSTAGPTLDTMGHVLGNVAQGFAGLLEAFKPVSDQMGRGLVSLTGKFADFGANAGSNSGFQKFLDYIEREGPVVVSTAGSIAGALGHIAAALAPIGDVVLRSIGALANAIKSIPTGVLTGMLAIVGPLAAGIYGINVASKAWAATTKAWGAITGVMRGITLGFQALTGAELEADAAADANPIGAVILALTALGVAIYELVKHWNTVKAAFVDAWDYVSSFLEAHWPLLVEIIGGPLGIAAIQVYEHWSSIKGFFTDIWDWVSGTFSKLWNGAKDIISTPIYAAGTVVLEVWDAIKSGAQSMWSDISGFFVAGINDVIGFLDGFIDVVNKVLGFFNLPKIPDIGKIAQPAASTVAANPGISVNNQKRMATGGLITNTPMAIVGEGNPAFPEWVIPTDPAFRSRALGLYASLGTRLMAGGGVLGDIGGAVSSALGGIANLGRSIAARGISGALDAAEAPMKAVLGEIPAGTFRDVASGLITKVNQAIVGLIGGGGGGSGSPGGAGGAARWTSTVQQVLSMLGLPLSATAGVLSLINHESGGNPTAINLSDSNARAGHPSQGLMQTIPSTFAAYAGPYASLGITNPLANIYAGVSYALANYGLGMLEAGGRHDKAGNYIGYDSGGLLQPGYTLAYNGTGSPEPVFTSQQFTSMGAGGNATLVELKALRAEVHALRGDTRQVGQSAGQHVGAALNGLAAGAMTAARGTR